MNPGAVEEGAKVATGVVEALKNQPISLALIVMNVIFVGAIAYASHELNIRTTARYAAQDELIHKLIDQCNTKRTLFLAPTLKEPIHEDSHQ